eukprot:1696618-Rhodomonas_salina.2
MLCAAAAGLHARAARHTLLLLPRHRRHLLCAHRSEQAHRVSATWACPCSARLAEGSGWWGYLTPVRAFCRYISRRNGSDMEDGPLP